MQGKNAMPRALRPSISMVREVQAVDLFLRFPRSHAIYRKQQDGSREFSQGLPLLEYRCAFKTTRFQRLILTCRSEFKVPSRAAVKLRAWR